MILSNQTHRTIKSLVTITIAFIILTGAILQGAKKTITCTDPALRLKWYQEHVAMKETSMFKHLKWQFLGPLNVSGRMSDVEVVTPKGQHYTIYVAGASGGIWKTVNEGTTWEPVFQHGQSTAFGDIAIAPSNQDVIWAGTGEANIFRSSQAGAGVYKSTDAGKTWQHMGLIDTNTIARIVTMDSAHNKRTRFIFLTSLCLSFIIGCVCGGVAPPGLGAQIISLVQG